MVFAAPWKLVRQCPRFGGDDENPAATLRTRDASGELLAQARVPLSFKLTRTSRSAWAQAGFSAAAVHKA